MPHGRDDGNGTRGHGPDEALVAERQEVLEAASAAREHDHVDLGEAAKALDRLGDGRSRPRPLDVGLRDDDARRREAGGDPRQDVALGGRVVAGDERDPPREQRQAALARRVEQALRREPCLQALERRQVGSEPEALDRERAQAEVAPRLEQLRTSVHVDALAVRQIEPERVELAARHRRRRGRLRSPDP